MIEGKENKISLNELSNGNDWDDILSNFGDNNISDALTPESDFNNLRPLALDIKNRMSGISNSKCLKTGFSKLDENIDFLGSGLIIIEGKKKSGKTAFAIQTAIQALNSNPDIPVFYFAYGDSKKDIQTRFLLNLTKDVTRLDYRKGNFDDKAITTALKDYQKIGKRLFLVQGSQNLYPNKIKEIVGSTLDKFYKGSIPQENSCIVIVDYIQEVPTIMAQNAEERTAQVASSLKDIAKMLSIPLMVIYGNNDVEKLITQSEDIKVTIERKENLDFSSDVFISLVPTHHRIPSKINKNIPKDIKAFIFSAYKNKNGQEGEETIYFSPLQSRWYTASEIFDK